ncbi:hypothetical protein GIB67_031682, partial [Kingdonia uniflora]
MNSITGKSLESTLRGWLPKELENANVVEYSTNFTVPSDFGYPRAVLITNLQSKELCLMEIVAYLPLQTHDSLKDLRREDLLSVRGYGKCERKHFERVYDCTTYNDLGNPDKDDDLARSVLDGHERPYPRRCRTGRLPTNTDPYSESRIKKPDPVYVLREESSEETKQASFSASRLKVVFHNLLPSLAATFSNEDTPFTCFTEIDKLYNYGVLEKLNEDQNDIFEKLLLSSLIKKIVNAGEGLFKYSIPAIISRDRFSWLCDNEFAHQALAGVNQVNIEKLKEFPILSKLDPALYGPPESLITKELIVHELEQTNVEEAIENGQLFIIDYHDMLLPFVIKINALPKTKTYASRTDFYYTKHLCTQ